MTKSKKNSKLTTHINPLGSLLGAANEQSLLMQRQAAAQAAQQQAFNQQMDMSRLQMDAQMQSARLNQIAGGGLGDSGMMGGAAFGGGGTLTQVPAPNSAYPPEQNTGGYKSPDHRTIRQILQAETDEWLAPVTI